MPRKRIDEFIPAHGAARSGVAGQRGRQCTREDLERIVDVLDDVIKRLEALEAAVSQIRAMLEQGTARGGRPGRRAGRSRLWEALRESKYVMASESRAKLGISPQRLRSEAMAEGLVIVDAGGDFAVMSKSSFEEFKAMLAGVSTSDPEEAARELGGYGRLFQALRSGGQVYYDARRRRWRLLEG